MSDPSTKTVLVPIDGSANHAAHFAYLAKRSRTGKRLHICILNVQLPLPPSLFVTRAMIEQHHDSKNKEDLKGTPAILTKYHVNAGTLIRVGDPAKTIVQVARQKHC